VNVDVLIVGAGPAGLAAAIELRRLGISLVLVADREETPGGVPRHCAHTGFGLRDLRRVMTGPGYARRYADAAASAGAHIRTGTTVTGWAGPRTVTMTSPSGVETISAAAVLLATGCRERPRAARLVPGDRPDGVMTTGELQQRVYLGGERFPGRALIVGAEHVSFSAMVTLGHAGARVVALVTGQPKSQSYAAFSLAASVRWHAPIWTSAAVSRVVGHERLAGVELARVGSPSAIGSAVGGAPAGDADGMDRFVPCDTLVFTGDWIPDHELARRSGAALDPGTRGPAVDTALETSVPLVFAAGNLVHAAETADVAALGGRHAARHIAAALRTAAGAAGSVALAAPAARIPLLAEAPLTWVSPNAIRVPLTPPPRGRFLLRTAEFRPPGRFEVRQGGRLLASARHGRLVPGRAIHLGDGWAARADPAGGPVRVVLA
jgi:thioredoxin reductase